MGARLRVPVRAALAAMVLVAGACRAAEVEGPRRPEPALVPDDPSAPVLFESRLHVEESPPRVVVLSYPGDPTWPREILNRFLTAFHPDRVTFREDGAVEVRMYGAARDEYESVVLLRVGEAPDGLRVQAGTPRGIGPELSQECLDSLRFLCRFSGVHVSGGPSSGCLLPDPTEGAPPYDWWGAADAEFAAAGLVRQGQIEALGAGVRFYGTAGRPAEWHVDIDSCGDGLALEVFHEVSPMDPEGERAMLFRILRRATGLDCRPRD